MRRMWFALVALTGAALPSSVRAEEKSAAVRSERPADAEEKDSDRPGRRNVGRDDAGRAGGHLVSQLSKLREQMHEKLDLDREQRTKVDEMIGEHVDALRSKNKNPDPGSENANSQAEIKALRERLMEARESGDQETVTALREQLRTKMQERSKLQSDGTKQLIDALRAELNEKQVTKFDEIVTELRLRGGPRGRAGELGALLRAVRDPSVGLSESQKAKVDRIIGDGFRPKDGGKWDATKVEESVAKVRDDVMKELTPEQRTKVEALIAEAEKAPRGMALREMQRRGEKARPAPRVETPAEVEDGEPDSDE